MDNRNRTPSALRRTAIASALAVVAAPSMAQLVLEEVIVTAQKRAENVQDVAATVNVVSGDDLDRFQAFDFNAIADQTAGLTLASPNARNSIISMRGVSVDPESGAAAAVDPYWNDAVVRPDVAFTALYDLERVEVLRGPQGTLQGRTSPGGAINIITQRADLAETSGYVQGSVADDDGINTQFAYGMPIIEDKLGVRLSGVYENDNGADVKNLTTGFDDQEVETSSLRLSTVWQVTDTFNAQLIYQWLDNDTDDPKAMTGMDELGVRRTLKADDNNALAPTNNEGKFDIDALANLILNWEVMDHEVTGIIAYQDTSKHYQEENDRANSVAASGGDPTVAPTYQSSVTDTESTSFELRVASIGNDFWDYMVGLYYKDQNTDTEFLANSRSFPTGLGFRTQSIIPVYANDAAIFTFNTFYLTQSLQLEVGLRYTDYDNHRRTDVFFDGLNYIPPALEPFEDAIIADFESRFPLVAVPESETDPQNDAWTGSLKLRWDYTDDISVYGSYNRGYRNGGISISPGPGGELVGVDNLLYDSEDSDAFELGFKSTLLDGRANLNGALYYQKFDGYQGFVRGIQVVDDTTGDLVDVPGGIVFNGDANIWGAELEGRILLSETWNAGGSLSYSKGEWDGASKPCNDREPGETLGECDIDGDALGGEPEWSLSLNSEYFFPLESTEIYVRGLLKYTDDRLNTDASAGLGNTVEEFDSYHTLDLFAGWRSNSYSWDVSVWAKNVTDEDDVIFQRGPDTYDVQLSGGSYTQTNILKERTIGMTARYNF